MKLVICTAALLVASSAFADGPPQQYDEAIVTKMSLDPGETIENDDGAKEDPNAKMTPTARAFRNGIYNGRKMQKESDDSIPPLPHDLPAEATQAPRAPHDATQWASIPPQPYQYSPPPAPRPRPQAYYAPPPPVYGSTQGYPVAPPAYTTTTRQTYSQTTTSSYASPAPYREPYQQPQYQEAYYPPPMPPQQYIYIERPGQYPLPVLPTGYWPRGYQPHY